jgi:hypothetical protein
MPIPRITNFQSVAALSDEQKGLVYRLFVDHSFIAAARELGWDAHFKTTRAMQNAMHRIFTEVKADPERYGLSKDLGETIAKTVTGRRISPVKIGQPTVREQQEVLANQDIKELIITGRKKSYDLLHKKMDRIMSSKKRLDEVSLSTLAQTFGIIFDKAQIIQGQATENVALMAKIDPNMSPDDALSAVLKMREFNNEAKEKNKVSG